MAFQAFTSAEHAAIAEVLAHQHAFSPVPPVEPVIADESELHIALDGEGIAEIARQLHPAQGGEMNEAMVAAAKSEVGCRIVHNHPLQGSLSASDWTVLAHHPGMQMVAVNSRGTTFRGMVTLAETIASLGAIRKAEADLPAQWERMITDYYNDYEFDLADHAANTRWLVSLAIGTRLRDKGCVAFEPDFQGSDVSVLADPRTIALREKADQWCLEALP